MKKLALLFLILFISFEFAYSKDTFKDDQGNAGHADDLSKLLTGKPYYGNSGNHRLFPILTGLAHIMYLTVDSTHRADPLQSMGDVDRAIQYLNEHKTELKIQSIPNFNEFLTPGGAYHGEYTHLGWNHKYADETQQKWLVRKDILHAALGKQFSFFPLLDRQRLDSLSALLYYVHILGDHENNTITTARTRIPIRNLNEQDIFFDDHTVPIRWERNNNGIPQTNIIAELNYHLNIVFKRQQNTDRYKRIISRINGYLPERHQDKAKWLLQILFDNVPYLLKEETFARDFTGLL
jgi:hypothetical protein